MNRLRFRRAFTLLELMLAMGVVLVLAAFASAAYQRVTESGRATACVSNLRQLGAGLGVYLTEHNQTMPVLRAARASIEDDVPVIDNTLDKYVPGRAVFSCPSNAEIARISGTSFHWNNALNGQLTTNLNFYGLVQDQSRIPVLADKGREGGAHPFNENKVNILYADGHATKDLNFFTEQ